MKTYITRTLKILLTSFPLNFKTTENRIQIFHTKTYHQWSEKEAIFMGFYIKKSLHNKKCKFLKKLTYIIESIGVPVPILTINE